MTSSYTPNKNFDKPAIGDDIGTWGNNVNADWNIADKALGGSVSYSLVSSNQNVSQVDAQNQQIVLTGTLGANIQLIFPSSVGGAWIIFNGTSGSYTVTAITASAGTSVNLPQGYATFVYSDGTNIRLATGDFVLKTGDTMTGPLTVTTANITGNAFYGASQTGSVTADSSYIYVRGPAVSFQNAGGTTTLASIDSSGNLIATANVTAYSDARLKTNIRKIYDPLAIIDELNGVTFDWIKSGNPGIGLIAQEVQDAIPEIVVESPDGYLTVAYANLVAVLIEAVKELRDRVEELEAR